MNDSFLKAQKVEALEAIKALREAQAKVARLAELQFDREPEDEFLEHLNKYTKGLEDTVEELKDL